MKEKLKLDKLEDYLNTLELYTKTGGKILFADNSLNDKFNDFDDVYKEIEKIEFVKKEEGFVLEIPTKVNGKPSSLSSFINLEFINKINEPILITLPGYGLQNRNIFQKFFNLNAYSHLGIEIFHDPITDRIKVSSSIENSQIAAALAIRSIEKSLELVKSMNRKCVLLGNSFGAAAISAYLHYYEKSPNLPLSDKLIIIQGGHYEKTFLGDYYQNKLLKKELKEKVIESKIFPRQNFKLPEEILKKITVYINQNDNVAKGQEILWENAGEKKYIVGTHRTAFMKNILDIRKTIQNKMKALGK